MNNDCKCPFYCEIHGKCEECKKNISGCATDTQTYCGKTRIKKEEKKSVVKEEKKPIIQNDSIKKEKENTIPKIPKMNPPVFEKIIDVHKEEEYDNKETCLYCHGTGNVKMENLHSLFFKYKTVICHICSGTGITYKGAGIRRGGTFINSKIYYPSYHLLFNENGRLLICNYRIYDVENGKKIKELSPDILSYPVDKEWELISYLEGKITFSRIVEVYSGGTRLSEFEPIYIDRDILGYENSWKIFNEKNGKQIYSHDWQNSQCRKKDDCIKIVRSVSTRYGCKNFRYGFDCSEKGNIVILDMFTKKNIFNVSINDTFNNECQFDYSPVTKRLAGCSENGKIYIWHWDCKQ